MPITHAWQSAAPDGADPTLLQPSKYNAPHVGNPFGWINVKDPPFNAYGDGVHDDTVALQAAFDAAMGAESPVPRGLRIYMPKGVYLISSTLRLHDQYGICLEGDSLLSTSIQWIGAAGGTLLSIKNVRDSFFKNFTLTGDNAHTTTGLQYDGGVAGTIPTTSNLFEMVYFYRHHYGVRCGQSHFLAQCDETEWIRCKWYDCGPGNGTTLSGISTATQDANAIVTVTRSSALPAWLTVGTGIKLTGFTPAAYNGHHVVRTASGSSFTFIAPALAGGAASVIGAIEQTGWAFSVEDANAVGHNFFGGVIQLCCRGITANVPGGNGGSFNVFGMTILVGLNWDLEVYPSSRGTALVGVMAERGLRFLHTMPGSAATTVTCTECSINGVSTNSTDPSAVQFLLESSGGLNIIGGKFKADTGIDTIKIGATGANGQRQHISLKGAAFDGDPISKGYRLYNAAITEEACQFFPDGSGSWAANIGHIMGPVARGSAANPWPVSEAASWAGAMWYKLPSGTVLSAGANNFTINSKNCNGLCTIRIDAIIGPTPGGIAVPFSMTGKDTNAGTPQTAQITLVVTAGFTLTSDLVFRVTFEPETTHY